MVDQFLNYLQFEKGYSIHTIQSYRCDIEGFLSFVKNEELASSFLEVTRVRIVRNYIIHLDELNMAPKTVSRKLSSLRSFYQYLIKEGHMTLNVFQDVQAPKIPKRLPHIIEENEIEHLFKSIPKNTLLGFRNYCLLDMLYSSGLRASELTNLKVSDMKLSQMQLLIHGKGSKDRIVLITTQLQKDLVQYMTYIRPKLLAKQLDKDTHIVFLNREGKPLTTRGLQKILISVMNRSGEVYKIHPHMLRHAFASALLNHGADLRSVQELLGHAHLKSTQIYTHLNQATLQQQYEISHPRMKKEIKHENI
jgi:integrase/recombinase XerC